MSPAETGDRYDRLPATDAERNVAERASREEVLAFFAERFGVDPAVFERYSFWEKGKGKVWAFRGEHPSPVAVEAMGIHLLRTRQRFWKPTTDAAQLFGQHVERNRLDLERAGARTFWRGESQEVSHVGDPGYVVVTVPVAGEPAPLGVGLWIDGELRSMVPKGRREELGGTD